MALVQRRTSIHPIINRRGCDASELDVKVVSLGVKASQCQQVIYMVRSTCLRKTSPITSACERHMLGIAHGMYRSPDSGPFSNQTIVSREPDSEPYRH